MGVKWTCTLLCLLGVGVLLTEASSIRKRRAIDKLLPNALNSIHPKPRSKRSPDHQTSSGSNSGTSTSHGRNSNGEIYDTVSSKISSTGPDGISSGTSISSISIVQSSPGSGSGTSHSSSHSSSKVSSSNSNSPGTYSSTSTSTGQVSSNNGPGQGSSTSWGAQNIISILPNVGYYPFYTNQFTGSYNVPNFNYQDFLQKIRNNLEALQELHAKSQGPHQPRGKRSYAWSHAGAFMTDPNGVVHPDTRSYSYSWSSNGPTSSTGQSKVGAGDSWQQHGAPYQAINNGQRFFAHGNRLGYGYPFPQYYYPNQFGFGNRGGFGNDFGNRFAPNLQNDYRSGFGSGFGSGLPSNFAENLRKDIAKDIGHFKKEFSNDFDFQNFDEKSDDTQSANAFVSIGPKGGFQFAEIKPDNPSILTRFAEKVPPKSGHSFGTYTYTSSQHSRDSNGKETNSKVSTVAINDNGNVTIHTVHDP